MTVTISEAQTQACSSVSLTDDDIAEGTQTFSMSIDSVSPVGSFDSSEVVVIEIVDDEGIHVQYIRGWGGMMSGEVINIKPDP